MVFGKLPPPGFKKFEVGKDPIETEKSRQEWGAPPDWKQKFVTDKIKETMKRLRVSGEEVSKAKLQAIEFYCMQQEIVSHSEQADTQVMAEFRDFLLGKSKFNEDTNVVPWGKRKLVGEDIDAYLEAVMTAKFEYDKKIGKMRDYGMAPRTLEDAWLYFCFNLLKRDIPEELYLKTWAQFYPAGAITKGYTDAREARDEQRDEHGGDQDKDSEALPSRKMGYKENSVEIMTSFSGTALMEYSEKEDRAGYVFDFFADCEDTLDRVDNGPRRNEDQMEIDGEEVHVNQAQPQQQQGQPEVGAGGADRSRTRSGREYGFPFNQAQFAQMLTASIERAITPAFDRLSNAIGASVQQSSVQMGEFKQILEQSMLKQAQGVEAMEVDGNGLDDQELAAIRELAFENTKGLATLKNDMAKFNELLDHNNKSIVELANALTKNGAEQREETIKTLTEMRNAVLAVRDQTEELQTKAMEIENLESQGPTVGRRDEGDGGAGAAALLTVEKAFSEVAEELKEFQKQTLGMFDQIKIADAALVESMKSIVESVNNRSDKNLAADIASSIGSLMQSDSFRAQGAAQIEAAKNANLALARKLVSAEKENQALKNSNTNLVEKMKEAENVAQFQAREATARHEAEKEKIRREEQELRRRESVAFVTSINKSTEEREAEKRAYADTLQKFQAESQARMATMQQQHQKSLDEISKEYGNKVSLIRQEHASELDRVIGEAKSIIGTQEEKRVRGEEEAEDAKDQLRKVTLELQALESARGIDVDEQIKLNALKAELVGWHGIVNKREMTRKEMELMNMNGNMKEFQNLSADLAMGLMSPETVDIVKASNAQVQAVQALEKVTGKRAGRTTANKSVYSYDPKAVDNAISEAETQNAIKETFGQFLKNYKTKADTLNSLIGGNINKEKGSRLNVAKTSLSKETTTALLASQTQASQSKSRASIIAGARAQSIGV